MTEIPEVVGMELIVPFTGEVVPLDDPAACARIFDEAKELERKCRELRGYLGDLLMEESRRQGSKTLHFEGYQVKINTPNDISWDYETLLELQQAGLPEERFNDLVTTEYTIKVNGLVAKSIGSSNEVYKEILERAQTKIPKSPSVSITPKGSK